MEPAQMLGGNIILALPFAKLHHRNLSLFRECIHGRDKAFADRVHQGAGNKRVSAMVAEEPDHAQFPLQLRYVHVQVHPVDSLDLQADVIGKHFRYASWYAHFRLRYDFDLSGSTAASAAYILGENCSQFSIVDRSLVSLYPLPSRNNEVHLVGLRRSLVRSYLSCVLGANRLSRIG